jgi:hypothetical protein
MREIKFIYFEGCPNAQKVRDSLTKIGIKFAVIEQTQLVSNSPYKDYSSPTILRDGKVVFGKIAKGGGCTLHIPSEDSLKELF